MQEVYIHDALRTPRGKAKVGGGLAALRPQDLIGEQLSALTARCGDAAREADALLLGCVGQIGDQGGHIALVSKLAAGLADDCAALSLNNYCVSGLSAIGQGAAMVGSGQAETVLAGGVEMMSRVPFMGDGASFYSDLSLPPRARYLPAALAADRLANSEGISREELDAAALQSQQKAAAANDDKTLQASRIPAAGLERDECVRPHTSAEGLAEMAPAFAGLQEEYANALEGERFTALHTLGHAPPICDGAGLALIGGRGATAEPRARIVAYAECGGDPAASFTAGRSAMEKVLGRAGMRLSDMDRIEYMESFAVTIAQFLRRDDVDPAKVNVAGGHIAKGHPLGASGAILLSSLLDCLDAAEAPLGLVVATGASGTGNAMIVERLKVRTY